jgi:hypothetical protein
MFVAGGRKEPGFADVNGDGAALRVEGEIFGRDERGRGYGSRQQQRELYSAIGVPQRSVSMLPSFTVGVPQHF